MAEICVKSIAQQNAIIEAGGEHIYTRKQIIEIIHEAIRPGKKVKSIPIGVIKFVLPMLKILNQNLYDKLAFFLTMLNHDVIAPKIGTMRFENYIKQKMN